jgi:hypothetical protein
VCDNSSQIRLYAEEYSFFRGDPLPKVDMGSNFMYPTTCGRIWRLLELRRTLGFDCNIVVLSGETAVFCVDVPFVGCLALRPRIATKMG